MTKEHTKDTIHLKKEHTKEYTKEYKTYFDAACDVFGMTRDELRKYIELPHSEADARLKDAWIKADPKSEDEIVSFYTDNIEYSLFQLRIYHDAGRNCDDNQLFRLLEKYIIDIDIKNMKILDYGCGCATSSVGLINSGCKNVYFMDLNTPLFEIVKRVQVPWIGKDRFIDIKKGVKYPLKDGEMYDLYDLILCKNVLEYVKDSDKVLKHLSEHTRYIYITTSFGGENSLYRLKENADRFSSRWKRIIQGYGLRRIYVEDRDSGNGLYSTSFSGGFSGGESGGNGVHKI